MEPQRAARVILTDPIIKALGWSQPLSRAFVKEDHINEVDEAILSNRTVSSHPNLVTQFGLKALERQLQLSRDALSVVR